MIVVRLRTAKLIVRNTRAEWAVDQILQDAAPAIVANDYEQLCESVALLICISVSRLPLVVIVSFVQFVRFLKSQHAGVMVAAQRLTLVRLEGVQADQIAIINQGISRRVPHKAIDPVTQRLGR